MLRLSEDQKKFEVILNLKSFARGGNGIIDDNADYAVYSVFPAEIALRRLKVRKDHSGTNFLVKHININFPSGQKTSP